jgi:hypothetical protein
MSPIQPGEWVVIKEEGYGEPVGKVIMAEPSTAASSGWMCLIELDGGETVRIATDKLEKAPAHNRA